MLFLNHKKLTKRVKQTQFFLLLSFSLLSLASCGGGGGSGQGPDPLAIDIPIAYVERSIPVDEDGNLASEEILDPAIFNGGASLFLRDRASQSANSINITDRAFGAGANYDVKDVEVSYNGLSLIFSMRAPQLENVEEEDQPKWNLWIYNIETNELAPFITNNAEDGHDISPAFLPDGRVIFSSTRHTASRSLLIDELKPEGSVNGAGFVAAIDDVEIFNLHIADPINDPLFANIQQVTSSQGHDLQATVLQDGRIAFLRYDAINDTDNLSIYTINSDGSNMRILYGYHSQNTGDSSAQTTFVDFRELADGSLIAILQTRESALLGGDIIRINTPGFTDINQPTNSNSAASGAGQQSLTPQNINLDNPISVNGLYNSVYPFSDGSMKALVGRNLCSLRDPSDPQQALACTEQNLQNTDLEGAPPNYGVWTFNLENNTIVPIAIAPTGTMFTDSVILEPRLSPPVSVADSTTFSSALESEGLATLNIRSVYGIDGIDSTPPITDLADPAITIAADRPARFIRLIKPVSLPSEDVLELLVPNFDNAAFGISQARGMREIIGYAPIEPDGSVSIKAPSGIPFTFDVVDANGTRTAPLHRNTLQLKGGEFYQCTGCHTRDSNLPHGRIDAEAPSANIGGQQFGLPFPNSNPNLFINEIGETMADIYTRFNGAARDLSTGLEFTDEWTDSALLPRDPDVSLLYRDVVNGLSTAPPVSSACESGSTLDPLCRIVINYPTHIQPLWETPRIDGADNNQCTLCHSLVDAGGVPQTPFGQLELTDAASIDEPFQVVSYRELVRQDTPKIIGANGLLLTLFVQAQVGGVLQIQLDAMGDPILDMNGGTIPVVRTFSVIDDDPSDILIQTFTEVPGMPGVYAADIYYLVDGVTPILDAGGNEIELLIPIPNEFIPSGENAIMASNAANSRFFDVMSNTTGGTVDHTGFMNDTELRLLREWIDIGAQYYNNPFDVPD